MRAGHCLLCHASAKPVWYSPKQPGHVLVMSQRTERTRTKDVRVGQQLQKNATKKKCHNCKSRGDGFGFFCKPHEQNCNLYGCKASDNEKMKQKAVPSVFHPYFAAFTTRSDHNRALFEFQKGSEGTGLIETQSPLNHYLPPNMPIPGNITVPETQNADAGLSPPKVPVKASVLTT